MRRVLRSTLLGVALLVLLVATATAAVPTELQQYSNRVDSALRLAQDAETEAMSQAEAEELALQISTLMPGVEEISTPDGTVRVDNSILRSLTNRLASAESSARRASLVREIDAHLSSMSLSLSGEPAGVPEDPEALSEILGDQYVSQRSSFAALFGDLVERLIAFLQGWWDSAGASGGTSTVLTFVTLGIIAALLLFLAILLVRAAIRAMRVRAAGESGVATPLPGAPGGPVQEKLPDDPLGAADDLATQGRLTDAVRMLLRGATRALRQAGRLRATRSRTNGELLAQVAAVPEIGEPLRGLADLFDRSYYGHREPDAGDYAAARGWYVRLAAIGDDAEGTDGEAA